MFDPAKETVDEAVKPASLTRALPYWAPLDGVMLLGNGSYEIAFEVSPLYLEAMSDTELELLHARLMRLVEAIPAGERLRFTYCRFQQPASLVDAFSSRGGKGGHASEVLHERRVAHLRRQLHDGHYVGRRLLVSFTYRPRRTRRRQAYAIPAVVGGAVTLFAGMFGHWGLAAVLGALSAYAVAWLTGTARPRRDFSPIPPEEIQKDMQDISSLRNRVSTILSSAGMEPKPLGPEGYMEWAWRHFNPGRSASFLNPPRVPPADRLVDVPRKLYSAVRGWLGRGHWVAPPSFRELVAQSSIIRDEQHLFVDGRYLKAMAMDSLPVGTTTMNLLGTLLSMQFPATVVVDIVKDPRGAAIRKLTVRQRILRSVAISDAGQDEPSALRGMEEVAQTQYRLAGGETDIVRIGCAVLVHGRTREEADDAAEQVVSWFATNLQDAKLVVEDAALAKTFIAAAPFSGRILPRTRAAEAENGVDFLPLIGPPVISQRPVMPLSTRYASLCWLDPFDPKLSAWNAVLAGPTGSGKTVFAVGLALHTYSAGARVIVVDRGSNTPSGPWLTATRVLGGQYIPFDPAAGVSVNPCDLAPEAVQPDPAKISFLTTLISRMASEKGEALGLQERNIVQAAIRQAYLRHAYTGPDGKLALQPLFLRDIVSTLRNLGAVAGTHDLSEEDRDIAKRIATRLYQWVDRGRYAGLVDRPSTVSLQDDWILLDVAPVSREPEIMPVAVLLITDLVWRHVSGGVGERPTLIIFDEVWAMLADSIASDFIQDLYRRLRTTGSGVLSISQDLADFRSSPHAVAILSNAQTYYLTRAADPQFVAELLQLNARQERQLSTLGMAKGVYGELMIVRRLGDRQEAAIVAYVPSPHDRWISESDASSRLLRERFVSEYLDHLEAIEALAGDYPAGVPDGLAFPSAPVREGLPGRGSL